MALQETPSKRRWLVEHKWELLVFGGLIADSLFLGWEIEKSFDPTVTWFSDSTSG